MPSKSIPKKVFVPESLMPKTIGSVKIGPQSKIIRKTTHQHLSRLDLCCHNRKRHPGPLLF